MAFAEYGRHDALGLAELVRKREVSAAELVEEAIARLERVNPSLDAVVHRTYERARTAAKGPLEGPFAGVPILLKDLLTLEDGEPTSSGSWFYDGWRAREDSELVRRIRRGGFLSVGRTSTPEWGITPVTEPARFGPARNPWSPDRTPGGSSGGSAAVVAAGVVPVATGGDGGGSIRIPASCCGLFGLKPTRGRTPNGPEVELWQGCAVQGALTRTVRDSAAFLDLVAGNGPGDPYWAPPRARPYLDEVAAEPGKLRIALTTHPLLPATVDPECARAAEDAAQLCRSLGHEVEEARPEIDGPAFSRAFVTMLVGEVAANVRDAERTLARPARSGDCEATTVLLQLLGESASAADYAHAVRDLKRLGRTAALFFERYDVLLTPTLARPPLEIGQLLPRGLERVAIEVLTRLRAGEALRRMGSLERLAQTAWAFSPFTAVWNVSGQPAMSVPLSWSSAGLPIGSQFVGRFGDEGTLFRLAGQLERARPWRERRPPISG